MNNKKQKTLLCVEMCSITTVGQMLSGCNRNNKTITELQIPQTTEFIKLWRLSEENHVVCFLLGNSPASEFYVLTFWNTLSVPSSQMDKFILHLSAYEDGKDRVF